MNKYIFFVFDNRSLICALGILEHLGKCDSVEFVVRLEKLAVFIESLNIPNSKIILFQDKIRSLKNIKGLIEHKRVLNDYYKKQFAGRRDHRIYFFETGWELPLLSFIVRLSKNNMVYYYERHSYRNISSAVNTFRTMLMRLLYKLLYSLDVCVYRDLEWEERFFPEIKIKSLSKYSINKIDVNIDFEDRSVFKKYANKNPQLSKAKALFLLADYVSIGIISQQENDIFLGRLASLFAAYFARDEVIVKEHPSSVRSMGSFFGEYLNVDSKIPAEFLFFSGQIKIVIGVASLSLKSAAKFENFMSVGLFRLFKSISADEKLKMQKNLSTINTRVDGELRFPESWAELEVILKSISEKH